MSAKLPPGEQIGYSKNEFRAILMVYSHYVFQGLFKDFSFSNHHGRYFVAFLEEAGRVPLVTIEKQYPAPDQVLFVATMPGMRGRLIEIAKSETIGPFIQQLTNSIETLCQTRAARPDVIFHTP